MAENNRRPDQGQHYMPDDFAADDGEGFEPAEYETMLILERLESLEEEMEELGVTTLEEIRQQIAKIHQQLDQQG